MFDHELCVSLHVDVAASNEAANLLAGLDDAGAHEMPDADESEAAGWFGNDLAPLGEDLHDVKHFTVVSASDGVHEFPHNGQVQVADVRSRGTVRNGLLRKHGYNLILKQRLRRIVEWIWLDTVYLDIRQH